MNKYSSDAVMILRVLKSKFYNDINNIKIRIEVPGIWTPEMSLEEAIAYCKSNECDKIHMMYKVEGFGTLNKVFDCVNPEVLIDIDRLKETLNHVMNVYYGGR